MSASNQDRTIAVGGAGAGKGARGGVVDTPAAKLICVEPGQIDGPLPNDGVVRLVPGGEQVIGRDAGCSFLIPSRKLSRQHARVFAGLGTWGIEDLNSTNGVLVNKQRVKTAWLNHGDEVRLGPVVFRFELERPDEATGVTITMAAATAALGPDDGDRTMMVGSLGASRAVIDAVRKGEPEPVAEPAARPRRDASARPKAVKEERAPLDLRRIIVYGVALVLLAGIGIGAAVYVPIYQRGQRVAEVLEGGGRAARIVIARVRDMGGNAATDIRFQEDVQALKPALDNTWNLLATYPDESALAEAYARLRFLSFERTFADLFARDQYREASQIAADTKGRLAAINRDLPASVAPSQRDVLTSAIDLLDFAQLLVRFRTFARQFPVVSKTAPAAPTLDLISTVDREKEAFIRYRRLYNEALSVDYLLFNAIVREVENRDLTLINHWKEYLSAGRG